MKNIIKAAEEYALSEMEKFDSPSKPLFDYSNKKGLELAKRLNVDSDVVQIGTRLMDIQLGQAKHEDKREEHTRMGAKVTERFLSKFDISEEKKQKIINAVEAHHGTEKWLSKEAEIVANADCYRFLAVRNCLQFLHHELSKLGFEEALNLAEKKADEKWNTLSLDICKKELEPQYKLIKEIIAAARKS